MPSVNLFVLVSFRRRINVFPASLGIHSFRRANPAAFIHAARDTSIILLGSMRRV